MHVNHAQLGNHIVILICFDIVIALPNEKTAGIVSSISKRYCSATNRLLRAPVSKR